MGEVIEDRSGPPLSQLWQLPVLVLSVLLFGVGVYLTGPGAADHSERYGENLDAVSELIRAGRYGEAVEALEGMSGGIVEQGSGLRGRFHRLVGDAMYLGQRSEGWSGPTDGERVVRAYTRAAGLGVELDAERVERLAETHAAMGDTGAALALLDGLGEAGAEHRQGLLKGVIGAAMERGARGEGEEGEIEGLLERLLDEPGLTRANEVWAVARQTERMMDRGEVRGAIDTLLRRIARLQDDEEAPLGELMVLLGRAYLADGGYGNAERWLLRARQELGEGDPLHGAALVGLGRVRFEEGNAIEALEHFAFVVERYEHTAAYPEALLGKAEAESRRGATGEALADYGEAVERVLGQEWAGASMRGRLIAGLGDEHDIRFGRGEYGVALRFLDLERRLLEPPFPPRMHLKRAVTHERIAEELLGVAEGEPADGAAEGDEAAPAPAVQREAAEHYAASADAYLDHARAVRGDDAEAYGRSAWRAGEHYDKAGLHKRAIAVYGQFAENQTEDPRTLAATHRLAQAYEADGQLDRAAELYQRLIEEHPKSPEAYASLVPLARCHLKRGPGYVDRAERVLRSVVTDHPSIRPRSTEYRLALVELGRLYYRRGGEGDYERAIERLDEAVARYAEAGKRPGLLFQLGDAYRKSAGSLDRELAASMPPSKREELEAERARRLERAGESFGAVIRAYDGRDPAELDELHRLYLRNSYFYRADCAYDLGRFEGPDGAIALYEATRRAYDDGPAALVALVQIANSYAELGRWDDARRANERAKVYLGRIPEEAFDDPNLPMDRQHWQRWLDWTGRLALTESGEGGE